MADLLTLDRLPPEVAAHAARWRGVVRACAGQRLALAAEDRLSFTGALLAAWAEGRQVVLPGDTLPATVQALRPHVDAFLGDFPGGVAPGEPVEAPMPRLDPEAEALVVFTSGSTGQPLAIPKRLRQLADEVRGLEACFGPRLPKGAAVVATVSHQHIYGLLFAVLWPLATGRILTSKRYEFPEQLEPVFVARQTVLVTSPAHLKRLPSGQAWAGRPVAIFSSGGPLSVDAAAHTQQLLGVAPFEVYGSSETGGIAWRTWEAPTWAPLPGVEWRLGDDGALEVRSPHLPDREWFRTADRAQAEGRGFVLQGRADRIAKVEEKRVSLDALERELVASGLLSAARVVVLGERRVELGVVGVPTADGLTLLRRGKKALVDVLKGQLKAAVELVALPRRFRFVDQLPANAQGKVTQAALELLFAPERPTPEWLERASARAVLTCAIPASLRCLDGHFPGQPIVPGVAQLDWALAFGREVFPLPGEVRRLDALKFQAIMRPGDDVRLELDWNTERAVLAFRFSGARGVYSSGRAVFA